MNNSRNITRKSDTIFSDYFDGKQSLFQLSNKFNLSIKTIRSKLLEHCVKIPKYIPKETVIIMDTTYFRRDFGVMVFRDYYGNKNLFWCYVTTETIKCYQEGINLLISQGRSIIAIVCDGRKGLFKGFKDIPVQMCHFYQKAIIRRYLTQNPRTPASRELNELSNQLKFIDRESWDFILAHWYEKWKGYLKEKTVNASTGKWHYTHKRLRSAYRSLKTNTPYLFIWQKYPKFNIPNTSNSLEGSFTDLKNKLRNHAGIKDDIKMKLTDHYFAK